MNLSISIMAHPEREEYVDELREQLPKYATVTYDRMNSEWDTARRALLDFDPGADRHIVLQDDAILCGNFVRAARAALKAAPPENPVSFYTGSVRPFAEEIEGAVKATQHRGLQWLALRGPIWGVACAYPVQHIEAMVDACDAMGEANYDDRISEYFRALKLQCWYTLPSLVDHRPGPSLLDHDGEEHRCAHAFAGKTAPLKWGGEAHHLTDPSEPWYLRTDTEGYRCASCNHLTESLPAMVRHNIMAHEIGPIDLVATTPGSINMLEDVWKAMPEAVRGTFWIVGHGYRKPYGSRTIRRTQAKRYLSLRRNFTIVYTGDVLELLGNRPGWAMTGQAN